ncbi:MAG: LysO family transporter [Candidatus Cloacimonetes bacterium]|nr:LysO family transporter [Candidatus Cloacimonadota bacterium]MBS3768197.1 LysO family transporter [Candidatus Cloacimonadota bacterium]
MLTVLALMTAGVILGFLLRDKCKIIKHIDKLINIAIYLLLFLLGISVGTNRTIINHLDKLGAEALVLSIGAVAGSVTLAFFTYKYFFKQEE